MDSENSAELSRIAYLESAHQKGAEAFITTDPRQQKEGFDVAKLARQFPTTREELIQILQAEDNKSLPKLVPTGAFTYSTPHPEFVPLSEIVGGPYRTSPTTWLVDLVGEERPNRGANRILEIIENFQNGETFNPNAIIKVIKHDNEYYIGADGRHRIGALKAMGVPELPMLIVDATKH